MKNLFNLLAIVLVLGAFETQAEAIPVEESKAKADLTKSAILKESRDNLKQPIDASGSISVERKSIDRKKRTAAQQKLGASKPTSRDNRKRVISPKSSSRNHYFSIYDAWVTLDFDGDSDGFYSEFSVGFDADVSEGSADVYAEIYISQNGGDWEFLGESESFTLYGDEEDEQLLGFSLLNGYPTDQYDILIDLYEIGVSGIAATSDPSVDGDLAALYLEDASYDGNTLITYVASTLSADYDRDGFYTKLALEFDIDTFDSGRAVYLEVEMFDTLTGSRRVVSTLDFTLGNQTELVDIFFESGYRDSWFDVEIRVIDFYSGEEITYAAENTFSSLRELPIESEEYDYDDEVIIVTEGGGSFGFVGMILLGLLSLRRATK